MIPQQYEQLARIIHEERIQAAQARRPEWMYAPAPPKPPSRWRLALAQALLSLAARLETTASPWRSPGTRQTSHTP